MADRRGSAWDVVTTPWHLDEHLVEFPVPVGARRVVPPHPPVGPVARRMNRLHQAAAAAVGSVTRPLILSGDCPTARAALAPTQRHHPDLTIVWIDAHGDFNTPAISTSGYLGGMALAMLTGRTNDLFEDSLGLRPVPDTNVVLAGVRDLDPAERRSLDASQVHRVSADPSEITSALSTLGPTPVFLHLDIDVIDAGELSGARFPADAGPSLGQIEECLASVCATAEVVGASVACAWLPDHVGGQSTRDTISRLGDALGTSLTWP